MNLGLMQTTLRDLLEVELEDWPDSLINVSIEEGYQRLLASEYRWPHLQDRWEVHLLPAQGTVDLVALGINEVTSVWIGTDPLTFTDSEMGAAKWGDSTGSPVAFSRWGDDLEVWPPPVSDEILSVRGYRTPLAFDSVAGWIPDMPVEFHSLLMDWALANEYHRQDDVEMSTSYRQKFQEQVQTLLDANTATPTPAPMVMGGGPTSVRRPLAFPWE